MQCEARFKGCEPLPAVAVLGQCRSLDATGPALAQRKHRQHAQERQTGSPTLSPQAWGDNIDLLFAGVVAGFSDTALCTYWSRRGSQQRVRPQLLRFFHIKTPDRYPTGLTILSCRT